MYGIIKTSVDGVYDLFKIKSQKKQAPFLFDSPHSGTSFPDDFAYACTKEDILEMSDLYVDRLFEKVVNSGAVFMKSNFPRSYIDLNRRPNDVDLQILDGIWPDSLDKQGRASRGVGLVHRVVRSGVDIYEERLKPEVIEKRLDDYYRPYYTELEKQLDTLRATFGCVFHFNCHSMPSTANLGHLPDINLGDRSGASSDPDITALVADIFISLGYGVSINSPYKGFAIIEHTGRPQDNRHSIQIEINRGLYMNEKTLKTKKAGFAHLKADLETFVQKAVKALPEVVRSHLPSSQVCL